VSHIPLILRTNILFKGFGRIDFQLTLVFVAILVISISPARWRGDVLFQGRPGLRELKNQNP